MHFCKFTIKEQFKLGQTCVVKIWVSSPPYFEKLTLVPRYFKPDVFLKMPYLTLFEAEMVIVPLAQLNISDKVLRKSKNNVGKTIARNLGINLNQRTFRKKLRSHAIDIKMFEFKATLNADEQNGC